ncbi:ABC transporter ATP-binding protein [Trueperella pecoris]|uniref:ABC transporter ATP-binding protein n=1 Tax=Trueperella pecoris TaxID=2733571 RepID=A0A7M1QW62_9ACTO|nr:ABC transporter ATP-binding protein [Trueperella pecoris]QOR45397.1 ABC transporter ATP-binding protein [Trueperella pecoris]
MNDQITCINVSAGYGGPPVIRDIDLEIPSGKITALIGPNGCGKSTLLKTIGRQLGIEGGDICLGGRSIADFGTREFARRLSFLPQQPTVPEGMVARELIAFGRYPYTGAFASLAEEDHREIEEAASATRVLDYLDRPATQLSGGQRQRMWIAMTLAQQSSIMLLDEPTTFLDPAHQLAILDLVADLNRDGRTVVMVVHDMVHAAKYSDHVVVMKDGRILDSGPTKQTLDSDLIERAFGISAMMVTDPQTGRKLPIAYAVSR